MPYEQLEIIAKAKRSGSEEKRIFEKFVNLAGASVVMGMHGQARTDGYIKSQMNLDQYVSEIRNDLNRAKVCIDVETQAEIKEYEKQLHPHGRKAID